MKKLLAILLSALLLCTMIPFATVFAADEPTIVVSTVEEADAGDEIEVEVNLVNNPGIIAAAVEIAFDESVMELVTYYDEDEEMDLNMIEVGSSFNASSNKYITFGPLGKCSVVFTRGTAKSNVTKELFFTATFKIKDDAVSGTYPLTVVYNTNNFVNLDKQVVNFGSQDTTIVINGTDPEPDEPTCEHTYDDEYDAVCNVCGDVRVAKYVVKTFGGNSIEDSEDGLSGLAFKFNLTEKVSGLAVWKDTKYVADYSNATVIPDTTNNPYKLVRMGAKVSNGAETQYIPVKKWVLEDGGNWYAIRIINIPEAHYNTEISCTPYFVYEDAEGNEVTVFGDTNKACAADFMTES